jgi:S-adenosylmethionine hydrolase
VDAIISFLTDFGTSDISVGQCKGVMAGISPKTIVVDISHSVPPFDVVSGSWMLRSAVPHFPPCVHVAVVDPSVGTSRRAIAIEAARGDVLIGPDNGLLLAAAEMLGGVVGVVELANPAFHHHPVSHTFHARDIFCPAAAHVSHGVTMHLLGPNVDVASLVQLDEPQSSVAGGMLRTKVVGINEFGSLALAAPAGLLSELGAVNHVRAMLADRSVEARVVRTFGDASVGEAILFVDSYARLCLALNQQDLARSLGLARTDRPEVTITAHGSATDTVSGGTR